MVSNLPLHLSSSIPSWLQRPWDSVADPVGPGRAGTSKSLL